MRRLSLVLIALGCAALYLVTQAKLRIEPADARIAVAIEGQFTPGGQYPGEAFVAGRTVRNWGSWSGSDQNEGTLVLGPFPAPSVLRLGLSGYPDNPGNELYLQKTDSPARLPLHAAPAAEHWEVREFALPADWAGKSVRLIAVDHAKDLGGWLAVSEPLVGGRSERNNALLESLTAWSINGLALGLIFFAAWRWLCARDWLPPQWLPLGAAAVVALAGYAAFWAYWIHARLGSAFSWTVLGIAALLAILNGWRPKRWRFGSNRHARPNQADGDLGHHTAEMAAVLKLMVAIGAFYLALLHLFPTPHDFYTLGANRFREGFPTDNELSHSLAERLYAGKPARNLGDEWRSSDRPPLQSGWQLLTWPLARALRLDTRSMSGTSAVWFQLLWVAAAYGLLRSFSVPRARAAGWVAAFALGGFFLQNTLFTWPKLAAGAFACGAFATAYLSGEARDRRAVACWGAIFAGLAWLTHGGVAFSLLALMPTLIRRTWHGAWRGWLPGLAIFAGLLLPWAAYQKFYDPPGDRLLKWHLAGQTERDPRGAWETIRASYAKLGWSKAWENKATNFEEQLLGDWRTLTDVSPEHAVKRRNEEFSHTARALTWWPVLGLIAWVVTRRRGFDGPHELAALAGWLAVTIVGWCLLMFGPYATVVHQGSYAVMIGLFVLFSVLLERSGRGWLAAIAALQAVTFVTTWAIGNPTIHGRTAGLPWVLALGGVLGWFVLRAILFAPPAPAPEPARPESGRASTSETPAGGEFAAAVESFRAWWREPRLNVWVLAALAALLALRKPHALHTPQLWAEDGSIFLMQADLIGPSAITMPYMGYLHLLPRLIAWLAPRLLDPAWWPGFYNGVSFAIWVAVLGRFFSRRFDLPGKPWLALAFFLGPNTGEVLFNITNLQWLTAFVLIQQALIAPPTNHAQRIGDLVMLVLVSFTGPFAIAFSPLLAWRWWRDRSGDNFAALAVVAAGAAVQAWFVTQTGPKFDYQSAPFHLFPTLVVLARRLLVWPVLGKSLSLELPPAVVGVVGTLIIGALLLWALRPDPRRGTRARIVAAFLLILLAGVFRTRPDTWADDNLYFGDRYFYIPRVLLAWLFIFEFHATPRFVANFARVLCLAAVMVHLPDYRIPAPRDYHWTEYCDPIRRGVRGDMPILPDGWTLEYRGRPAPAGKR